MNKQDIIQAEALEEYSKSNLDRFSMDVGTGVGKSLLIIKHMKLVLHEFSLFLITIPKKSNVKSWEDEFKKHNATHLLKHVVFTTYLSLDKVNKIFDWVYLDECHNFKSDKHFDVICKLSKKTFAVTGTYISDKDFNYAKFTTLFPIIFTYKTRQSVNEEILNDYRIILHMIPLSQNIRTNSYINGFLPENQAYMTVNAAVTSAERKQRFASLKQLRITRMKMLQGAMSKIQYAKTLSKHLKTKTLIFVENEVHAKQVCQYTYTNKNSDTVNKRNMEMFCKGEINQLATILQLNESTNVPDLETGIVQHSYANKIKLTQRIGRFFRLGAETKRTAYIHILVYKNTVDEDWVKSALEDFDNSKIGKYPEEKTNQLLKLAGLL